MAISPKSFFSTPILIVLAVLAAVIANLGISVALLDFDEGCSCHRESAQVVPAMEAVEQSPFHQAHDTHRVANTNRQVDENRGFLGIQIATVDARTIHKTGIVTVVPGVLVVSALPEFNAYKAGFTKNDIITNVDGVRVTDAAQLRRIVASVQPGTRLPVSIIRDGQPLVLYPTVGATPLLVKQLEQERIERCRKLRARQMQNQ